MRWRPSQDLDQLRKSQQLRWLRSFVFDGVQHNHNTVEDGSGCDSTEALFPVFNAESCCAVHSVVLVGVPEALMPHIATSLRPIQQLTALDLQECDTRFVTASLLDPVAATHPHLQRLLLPMKSTISQHTLNRFQHLIELGVAWNWEIDNVDFCASTLRVLYAPFCVRLSDAGLAKATRLRVLDVSNCSSVTSLTPFQDSLLQLWAAFDCGITVAALQKTRSLQVLCVNGNWGLETLPLSIAGELREFCGAMRVFPEDNLFLASATNLVKLFIPDCDEISTIGACGPSLRELNVTRTRIADDHLLAVTNLVLLDASDNTNICSVAPFASSLVELIAHNQSGLGDVALNNARNLIQLDSSMNKSITALAPFAGSLRHLSCRQDAGVTTVQLMLAQQLVTLDCRSNSRVTSLPESCCGSIEEVIVSSDGGLMSSQLHSLPRLRTVYCDAAFDVSETMYCVRREEDGWGLWRSKTVMLRETRV